MQGSRITLTLGSLNFAVLAHTLNYAFIITLDKTRTTLPLPSVHIPLLPYVYFLTNVLKSLIVIHFIISNISISHSILKLTKQLKVFGIFFKSLFFKSHLQRGSSKKVYWNTLRISRRKPVQKSDFKGWNHTPVWVFSYKFAAHSERLFIEHLWGNTFVCLIINLLRRLSN